MSIITYKKLVRDKIPQIIKQSGKSCTWEKLSEERYIKLLNEKLIEEAKEYLESGTLEELADVSEVIYAILKYKNITFEELEKVRLEKRTARGGFEDKIFLIEVTEN